MSRRRWAVVGGGIVGCTVAHRLAQAGHDVVLMERAPAIGGLAAAWQVGPVSWDRYYHVILGSDASLLRLLDELGLSDDLRWRGTRTALSSGGTLHSVSSPLELLRLPVLPPVARVRLAATLASLTVRSDRHKLERTPVGDLLQQWSGSTAYQRFWLPLLRAKLGPYAEEASAAFLWATAQRLGRARRSAVGGERFGYVRGGYARILGRLSEVLGSDGVEVRTGALLQSVEPRGDGGVDVVHATGTLERFDRAVLTVAGPTVASLCPALSAAERSRLTSLRYVGVVCVSLVLRRPLGPYYLTYLLDEPELTGVVDMSALVDRDQLGGHGLVYLPRYVAPDDPVLLEDDDRVVTRFRDALQRVCPSFDPADVVAARVARAREVFAVPFLGYSDLVLPFTTSVPGVAVVHSAQIVDGTLNANESVQLADRASKELVSAGPVTTAIAGAPS